MAEILILTETDLKGCVKLDAGAIDIVENAFAKLAEGGVVMPPVMRMDMQDVNGEVDVKTAYVPGLDGFAIKTSPGFFDNPAKGLPSTSGLMVVHSADTGFVQAVLLDNGLLTDIRTAAAGGVAAKALSRSDSKVLGIVGTGLQARMQAEAVCKVRQIEEIRVWGRDPDKAAQCVKDIISRTSVDAKIADSLAGMVRNSDIVVTTTPTRKPLITAEMLHPGLHITAMGSDSEHKNEIAPEAVAEADLFVCDRHEQSLRQGELHHAVGSGIIPDDVVPVELGQVLIGQHPGRSETDMITICDLTGTGVQDTAIALHALKVAKSKRLGTVITT